MNKSKIEWCDHTWNPITGCNHGCHYCYARTMTARFSGDVRLNKMCKADYSTQTGPDGSTLYVLDKPMLSETGHPLVYPFGFEPTFHRYRMDTISKLKMGNNIFVGAMADVFGEWVPDEWIEEIFNVCLEHAEHNYLFLTKNPERYMKLANAGKLPQQDNFWYGTTVTRPDQEYAWFESGTYNWFLSIEPILEDFGKFGATVKTAPPWIIVGAQTGRSKNKVIPEFEWIKNLVLTADTFGIPIFMKDSLIPIVGEKNMRRDFPKQLLEKSISEKMQNKLYEACSECGKVLRKNQMVALMARSKRGTPAKQYAYLCRACFENSCKNMGVELPKLDYMED